MLSVCLPAGQLNDFNRTPLSIEGSGSALDAIAAIPASGNVPAKRICVVSGHLYGSGAFEVEVYSGATLIDTIKVNASTPTNIFFDPTHRWVTAAGEALKFKHTGTVKGKINWTPM